MRSLIVFTIIAMSIAATRAVPMYYLRRLLNPEIKLREAEGMGICESFEREVKSSGAFFVNDEKAKCEAWARYRNLENKRWLLPFTPGNEFHPDYRKAVAKARNSYRMVSGIWPEMVKLNPQLGMDTVDESWLNQFVEEIKNPREITSRKTIADLESHKWQYTPDAQLKIDAAIQEIRDYYQQKKEERAMKEQETEESTE
jgi:hypothetical protein